MNNALRDYLERKMSDSGDFRKGYEASGMHEDSRRSRDYEDSRDMRDSRDSRDYRGDSRVYSGEIEVTDHRDGRDSRNSRYHQDYRDYRGGKVRLNKSDKKRWKRMFENFDGTQGAHYDMMQIMQVAEKLHIRFDEYDESEFCLAVNMMYADYGQVVKNYVGSEKELMCCAELAKAFLDDPDGPEPSEKLALYFHCIVDA